MSPFPYESLASTVVIFWFPKKNRVLRLILDLHFLNRTQDQSQDWFVTIL